MRAFAQRFAVLRFLFFPLLLAGSASSQTFGSLVFDGDSQVAHNQFQPALTLNNRWTEFNAGHGGYTVDQLNDYASAEVDPQLQPKAINIVLIWAGVNNCRVGNTPQHAWDQLNMFGATRHSMGWRTIIFTLPSLESLWGPNSGDACRDAINNLILANWRTNFDGLVRMDSAAAGLAGEFMGQDGDYSNCTFFKYNGICDGIHISFYANQNIVAQIASATINAVAQLPSTCVRP